MSCKLKPHFSQHLHTFTPKHIISFLTINDFFPQNKLVQFFFHLYLPTIPFYSTSIRLFISMVNIFSSKAKKRTKKKQQYQKRRSIKAYWSNDFQKKCPRANQLESLDVWKIVSKSVSLVVSEEFTFFDVLHT